MLGIAVALDSATGNIVLKVTLEGIDLTSLSTNRQQELFTALLGAHPDGVGTVRLDSGKNLPSFCY